MEMLKKYGKLAAGVVVVLAVLSFVGRWIPEDYKKYVRI